MRYSVNVVLDQRRSKAKGLYPIKIRVIVNRQSFHISIGHNIPVNFWSNEKEEVLSKCPNIGNVTRVNYHIINEKSRILDKLIRLNEDGELDKLTLIQIKNILTNKSGEIRTLEYFDTVISNLEKSKRFGNARVYIMTRRSIADFLNNKDIPIKHITFSWLKSYEAWYLSKGNSINGLSVCTRTLRAIMNLAISEKKLPAGYYSFNEYTIKIQETRKRAISREDVAKIVNYSPQTKRQERAKDYFLMSFYLMGASFIDLANLKLKSIVGNRIEYKREKTGKMHSIPITEPLKLIINKYVESKNENDFILNVIHSNDPKRALIQTHAELKRYNRSLKEIAKVCSIDGTITSYVARHTYATSAKRIGVPISVISEALGHTTEKTTQIYLDSFENETVDKYHELIIKL